MGNVHAHERIPAERWVRRRSFFGFVSSKCQEDKTWRKEKIYIKSRHRELWPELWSGIRSGLQRKLFCEGCTGSWREWDETGKNSSGWIFSRFFLTVTVSQRLWRWLSVIRGFVSVIGNVRIQKRRANIFLGLYRLYRPRNLKNIIFILPIDRPIFLSRSACRTTN